MYDEIYLIQVDKDEWVWCSDPAPGIGMDEKDAIKYMRVAQSVDKNNVVVSKELLLELKQGIYEAVYDDDGLDGADGVYLLSGINMALGLDVTDNSN